jgi:D-beta-D-heptose 7-phosphate kinase/D-beta-D-heptose 1-phosphate adenosyltransferase
MEDQLVTLRELAGRDWRSGEVVLIGGVFDLLHAGHIEHLQEAKSKGDILVVHITSDRRVKEKKGPRKPIVSEVDRARLVAAMRCVDFVFIDDRPHYHKELVSVVRPNTLLLNQEAVSGEVQAYLDTHLVGVNIEITSSAKVNNTSDMIQKIVNAFA